LKEKQSLLGEDHADTAVVHHAIGIFCWANMQLELALTHFEKAEQGRKESLHLFHKDVLDSRLWRAKVLLGLNRIEDANKALTDLGSTEKYVLAETPPNKRTWATAGALTTLSHWPTSNSIKEQRLTDTDLAARLQAAPDPFALIRFVVMDEVSQQELVGAFLGQDEQELHPEKARAYLNWFNDAWDFRSLSPKEGRASYETRLLMHSVGKIWNEVEDEIERRKDPDKYAWQEAYARRQRRERARDAAEYAELREEAVQDFNDTVCIFSPPRISTNFVFKHGYSIDQIRNAGAQELTKMLQKTFKELRKAVKEAKDGFGQGLTDSNPLTLLSAYKGVVGAARDQGIDFLYLAVTLNEQLTTDERSAICGDLTSRIRQKWLNPNK